MNKKVILKVQDLVKNYFINGIVVPVLKGVNLEVFENEFLIILGESGVGKTTLLHLLGNLDKPTSGKILFKNIDITKMSEIESAKFRNKNIGFVFQFHHLLPEFNALENVLMPAMIARIPKSKIIDRAKYLLERVGLKDRMKHFPTQLSGGEQQRVAIARALILEPEILLADEPTGNLDENTSNKIFDLIKELILEIKLTCVIVSHKERLASYANRAFHLVNGKIM